MKRFSKFFFFLSLFLSGCSQHLFKKEQFLRYIKIAEERFAYADYKGSLAALNNSLSVYPDNPWVFEQIGWIYLDLNETEKARIYFEKSLKSDENYFAATLGLWETDLKQIGDKEIPEIEKKIDFLQQQYIQNSDAQFTAYKAYRLINKNEKAFALVPHILKITNEREIVRFLSLDYIENLWRESDEEKREKGLLTYLDTFPLTKERTLAFGSLLKLYSKQKKKTDKLINISQRWLSEQENNRKANYLVSYFYSVADINISESLTLLSKAIKLIENPDPFDRPDFYPLRKWKKDLIQAKGRYYDLFGWLYFKKDDTENALKYFEKSLEFYPENPKLHYHFGRLKENEKDIKGAYLSYIKSISSGEEVEDISTRLEKLFKNLNLSNKKSVREYTADEMGITYFEETTNKLGLKNIQGTKVAWGDFNNDGFDDLLVDGHILFENQGGKGFKNVTEQVGLTNYSFANGGVWADFNNDGSLDFFMLGSKTSPGRFMKNNGGTNFKELEGQPFSANLLSNEGAAWGDFNNDGLVDIYVSNYEGPDSTVLDRKCLPDILLINMGGKFEDLSEQYGLYKSESMCGRGVSTGDYNNDGKMDIFVSNYRLNPNFLWTNLGISFVNEANKLGVEGNMVRDIFEWEVAEKETKQSYLSGVLANGLFGNTIASAWGDFDNDGELDLFSANLAHPRFIGYSNTSMLLKNKNGSFVDITEDSGINYNETDADPNFIDYDNDGFLDLFITSVYKGRTNRLFKGNGKKFREISWPSGLMTEDGWGNAFADFDNDGDSDLVVGSSSGLKFFENMGSRNNWLQVKLVGIRSNVSAIGGKVLVSSGNMKQIQYVKGGTGLSSQNSFTVTFGLNGFSKNVDVIAMFPSGKKVYRNSIKPNQKIVITE